MQILAVIKFSGGSYYMGNNKGSSKLLSSAKFYRSIKDAKAQWKKHCDYMESRWKFTERLVPEFKEVELIERA